MKKWKLYPGRIWRSWKRWFGIIFGWFSSWFPRRWWKTWLVTYWKIRKINMYQMENRKHGPCLIRGFFLAIECSIVSKVFLRSTDANPSNTLIKNVLFLLSFLNPTHCKVPEPHTKHFLRILAAPVVIGSPWESHHMTYPAPTCRIACQVFIHQCA